MDVRGFCIRAGKHIHNINTRYLMIFDVSIFSANKLYPSLSIVLSCFHSVAPADLEYYDGILAFAYQKRAQVRGEGVRLRCESLTA